MSNWVYLDEFVKFGQVLARERKARGWSQSDVASRLGMTGKNPQGTISKWETGPNIPSARTVDQLAEIFGLDRRALRALATRTREYWREVRDGDIPAITEPVYYITEREMRQAESSDATCGEDAPNLWEAWATMVKLQGQVEPGTISPHEWATLERVERWIASKRDETAGRPRALPEAASEEAAN